MSDELIELESSIASVCGCGRAPRGRRGVAISMDGKGRWIDNNHRAAAA